MLDKSLREGSDKQNVPGKKCRAGTENRNMYIKYDADKDRAMAANVQRNGTLVQRLCKIS